MLNKTMICRVCLLAVLPPLAHAEVFEWVDGQGRHHYSDRKQADARILTVEPASSYHVVEKVFDGDTILLSNGQKVRLLGVNTPEVASRNKNAEAGGEEAKAWLQKRLEHKKVRLEADVEKQDKYRRTLAYVFAEDKQFINLELIRQGWGAVNIFPPNLKYIQPLLAAQAEAEQAGLGLWRHRDYAPQPFDALNEANYKGWKRITGRIGALKKTAKYNYLQFSERVSVRIGSDTLHLFPALQDYVGKQVEARGWVNKSKDRFVLHVRHPGELKQLGN